MHFRIFITLIGVGVGSFFISIVFSNEPGALDSLLDNTFIDPIYYASSPTQTSRGVPKRESELKKRLSWLKNLNLQREKSEKWRGSKFNGKPVDAATPIQDAIEQISSVNIVLPWKGEKSQNLSKNLTRDTVMEFLRKPLSDQKGVDFYDPKDKDREDTPIFFLLDYINNSSKDPQGISESNKKLKRFILFSREKLLGSQFGKDISDEEFAQIVQGLNGVRDLIKTLTVSKEDGKNALLGKKYQKHIEALLGEIFVHQSVDKKVQNISTIIPKLLEDVISDSIFRLLPKYLREYTGSDASILKKRDEIAGKIRKLIDGFEYPYFDNAAFYNKDLKGNLKQCLAQSLIMDAMLLCVTSFVESTHGKMLAITMDSIQIGTKFDVDKIDLNVDRDVRSRALFHLQNFDHMELRDSNKGRVTFYQNREKDIIANRRSELGKFDFNMPHVKQASFDLPAEVENSDTEYLKLKMLYAIERSLEDWLDSFIVKLARGMGIGVDDSKEVRALREKFSGENGYIRQLAKEFLEKTDFGNSSNIFSTYANIVDQGVEVSLRKLKKILEDNEIETLVRTISEQVIMDKVDTAVGSKLSNTDYAPYRDDFMSTFRNSIRGTISSTLNRARGMDQQQFNMTLFDTEQREAFTKNILKGAIESNKDNLKRIVDIVMDQTVVRYKIGPFVKLDEGAVVGLSDKYKKVKMELNDKVVDAIAREFGKSIDNYSLSELIDNYEEIIISNVRNALESDAQNGSQLKDNIKENLRQTAHETIDHYTDKLNTLLDYHLVTREPLFRSSFLSYYGLRGTLPEVFSAKDSRHFGQNFVIAKKELKEASDSVIDNVLEDLQKDKNLKSIRDIQETINQRLKKELDKFHQRNKTNLQNISKIFATRAVYDLIPSSDLEKGTKSYESYHKLKKYLTDRLGPEVLKEVLELPDGFDFFKGEKVLSHLQSSVKKVVLNKEGTIKLLKQFVLDSANESMESFFTRYKNNPKTKNLINKYMALVESKIEGAFDVLEKEIGENDLTIEGLSTLIENIDSKVMSLFEQMYLTRVDANDESSQYFLEALASEIVDFEAGNVANLLGIKKGTQAMQDYTQLREHLNRVVIPKLMQSIRNIPFEKKYKSTDSFKEKLRSANERYKTFFINLHDEITNAINSQTVKGNVNIAIDSYTKDLLYEKLAKVMLPKPLESYPASSGVQQAFSNMEKQLNKETRISVEEFLDYQEKISKDTTVVERIGSHIDRGVNEAFRRLLGSGEKQSKGSVDPLLNPIVEVLFEENLKYFFSRFGFDDAEKQKSFVEFKNKFLEKFKSDFFPELKSHLKELLDKGLFDQLTYGNPKLMGEELLNKSLESFGRIFLNDPEMREHLFSMSDTMVDEILDTQKTFLDRPKKQPKFQSSYNDGGSSFMDYVWRARDSIVRSFFQEKDNSKNSYTDIGTNVSTIDTYRPVLKREMRKVINEFLDTNKNINGSSLTLDQMLNQIKDVIADNMYTPERAMFLTQVSQQYLFTQEGIEKRNKIIGSGQASQVVEIVKNEKDPIKREKKIEKLVGKKAKTFTKDFDDGTMAFNLNEPFALWEYLSISELLSSPYLKMGDQETLDPFLERLGQKDLSNALRPFGGRLVDFIKYQTFCVEIKTDSNEKSYPCYGRDGEIIPENVAVLIEFLRMTANAPYSENGGECFRNTWNFLSKEKFAEHLEGRNIDLIKRPLEVIGAFIEKEGAVYRGSPPSFMDCAVLGYGVEFGNRLPIAGLNILASESPGQKKRVKRLNESIDIFTSPAKFRAYLENPKTQRAKRKMQINLVKGLNGFIAGKGQQSNFSNPHEALMAQFVHTVTNDYLPAIVNTNDFRINSLSFLVGVKKDDPTILLKESIKVLIQKNVISGDAGDLLASLASSMANIEKTLLKYGHTSSVNNEEIKSFARQFPQCFKMLSDDFNAPLILAIQFLGAAAVERNEKYFDRVDLSTTVEETFSEMKSYLDNKACLQYSADESESILRAATSIAEVVSLVTPIASQKRMPARYLKFWEDATKEFGVAGKWVQDYKIKLDFYKWITDPKMEKEQMCKSKGALKKRLSEQYRKRIYDPMKITEKQKKLEELEEQWFGEWRNKQKIKTLKEDIEASDEEVRNYIKRVKYMDKCFQKDCK